MIKAEFHVHTEYSECSDLSLERLIQDSLEKNINCLAITDHNTMEGVTRLEELLAKKDVKNLQIIAGEEIRAKEGDLIGLFMSEKIDRGVSLKKAASEIKKQGGLVILPHPFDFLRPSSINNKKAIEEIINLVDFIEVHNGRETFWGTNKKAERFAEKNNIPKIIGSDAHTSGELGRNIIEIEEFSGRDDFVAKVKKAKFYRKSNTYYSFLLTAKAKIKNRFRKKG